MDEKGKEGLEETNGRHGGLDLRWRRRLQCGGMCADNVRVSIIQAKGMLQRTAVAALMEPADCSSSSRLRTRRSHR